MRILELFPGTGSIGKVFLGQGWEVISLDLDPNAEATIHENVLTWDHTVCPRDTLAPFGRAPVVQTIREPEQKPTHLVI